MNGSSVTGIEDIVRRNIAALRSKANLTQQGLADEMLVRGIPWTRETVAQVETTNRRLGFTEAIAVAACLDVPIARLTSTGADVVAVGDCQWQTAYLGAAIAGTTGDAFPPESYSAIAVGQTADAPRGRGGETGETQVPSVTERATPDSVERSAGTPPGREPAAPSPHKAAERIERRLRLRVTASDVDAAAQQLWSRSLEAEREQRVAERQALTGGSTQAIRGHVSRDLDREIAHEMERQPRAGPIAPGEDAELSPEEVSWEATRLNIILANKGYGDSDVTRWWNFTHHQELDDQTVAEAWRAGRYDEVSRLIESLPEAGRSGRSSAYYPDD